MKQRSILKEVSISGKALHTGDVVKLTLKPAPIDHGIVFQRIDIHEKPKLQLDIDLVTDVIRCTTIASGHTKIHTVEHILSALYGLNIDNVLIEINAHEVPILDGSSQPFVDLILEAGIIEQNKERSYFELREPISVSDGNRSIIALPYNGFQITCTSTDDRGIYTQHLSLEIDPENYTRQLSAARTFVFYEDIEALLKIGKIKGGSLESAIVIRDNKILSKEGLRFDNEFVRHKILDIIGDLALLGKPLKAHIIAVRPGHSLNAKLTRAVKDQLKAQKNKSPPTSPRAILPEEKHLNIKRILETLPHRYPFLMIDRVIKFESDTELIAVKNISINEPCFLGHFPSQPIFPGVLQIEAMAQAAGILMLRNTNVENKVAFFMSCDRVKFRGVVEPGDQLEIHVKLTKNRGNKIGVAEGTCRVAGKVVSSAELMFTITDKTEIL